MGDTGENIEEPTLLAGMGHLSMGITSRLPGGTANPYPALFGRAQSRLAPGS